MTKTVPTLVLTRPIEQAQPLAKHLTERGFSVALFPLFDILPLNEASVDYSTLTDALANLKQFALAVFVSANAIHAVFQHGINWPSEVSIAVMGEGSRAALASHGINETNARIFCPDRSSDSDSESLLRALDLPSLKGREVVIFRAETGRELLADALSANDIRVSKVIAYRRVAARLTEHTKNALSELTRPGMIWVISSSEALHYLVSMLQKRFGIAHLDMLAHLTVWVSHPRIAENAKKCGFKHIDVMGSGDENLLLALQSWSQQRSSFYER